MNAAALESGFGAATHLLKKFVRFARGTDTLTVAEKVYSIAAFLAIVTCTPRPPRRRSASGASMR